MWQRAFHDMWARAEVDAPALLPARRADYRMERRAPRPGGGRPVRLRAAVEVGTYLDRPDALARFLTARWWAFTLRAGRLWQVPVAHPDWPLHEARAVIIDAGGLLAAAGLPAPGHPPLVHFSPGVRTRLGLPRPS